MASIGNESQYSNDCGNFKPSFETRCKSTQNGNVLNLEISTFVTIPVDRRRLNTNDVNSSSFQLTEISLREPKTEPYIEINTNPVKHDSEDFIQLHQSNVHSEIPLCRAETESIPGNRVQIHNYNLLDLLSASSVLTIPVASNDVLDLSRTAKHPCIWSSPEAKQKFHPLYTSTPEYKTDHKSPTSESETDALMIESILTKPAFNCNTQNECSSSNQESFLEMVGTRNVSCHTGISKHGTNLKQNSTSNSSRENGYQAQPPLANYRHFLNSAPNSALFNNSIDQDQIGNLGFQDSSLENDPSIALDLSSKTPHDSSIALDLSSKAQLGFDESSVLDEINEDIKTTMTALANLSICPDTTSVDLYNDENFEMNAYEHSTSNRSNDQLIAVVANNPTRCGSNNSRENCQANASTTLQQSSHYFSARSFPPGEACSTDSKTNTNIATGDIRNYKLSPMNLDLYLTSQFVNPDYLLGKG